MAQREEVSPRERAELEYKFKEDEIVRMIHREEPVILTGLGGCGKSHMLRKLYLRLTELGFTVGVTGSTGIAAVNVGGRTLHSWAGIGLGDKSVDYHYKEILSRPKTRKRWLTTSALFLEEGSMTGCTLFDKIEQLGRMIRRNSKPFGGITLLICADFLQLPPVKDGYIFRAESFASFAFRSIRLEYPWRFNGDMSWHRLLERARYGKLNEEDNLFLKSRQEAYYREIKNHRFVNGELRPTNIYPRKMDVSQMNLAELDKLDHDTYVYQATDRIRPKGKGPAGNLETYQRLMKDSVPDEIMLKKDAQVILKYNLDTDHELCNGTRGVVLECLNDCVLVRFTNKQEVVVYPQVWTLEDEDNIMTREQIPLILGWAYTTHMSQSTTLDYAIVDLGTSIFCPGLSYVALSRVKDPKGLFIINFMPEKVYCDEEARDFDLELRDGEVELEEKIHRKVQEVLSKRETLSVKTPSLENPSVQSGSAKSLSVEISQLNKAEWSVEEMD